MIAATNTESRPSSPRPAISATTSAGLPRVFAASASRVRPERKAVGSGSRWEPIAGYARAVRAGNRILVSGTTATHGDSTMVCPGDAEGQTVYILDKIGAAIEALGGELEDVVRTRST